jgi:hypothetical protein
VLVNRSHQLVEILLLRVVLCFYEVVAVLVDQQGQFCLKVAKLSVSVLQEA